MTADDIPALLARIAQLLDQLAERDRRIRAQAEQIDTLRAMLAMTARTP